MVKKTARASTFCLPASGTPRDRAPELIDCAPEPAQTTTLGGDDVRYGGGKGRWQPQMVFGDAEDGSKRRRTRRRDGANEEMAHDGGSCDGDGGGAREVRDV